MCARYTDRQIYFKFFNGRVRRGEDELESWELLKPGASLASFSMKGPGDEEARGWGPRYREGWEV